MTTPPKPAWTMSEIAFCLREDSVAGLSDADCYLWGGGAVADDPICQQCPAHQSVRHARREHVTNTGEDISLPKFVARGLIDVNRFVSNRRWRRREWTR